MSVLFDHNGVRVSAGRLTFSSGWWYMSTSIINLEDIREVQVLYNNWLYLYAWRFIVGTLGLFTIIGIPEYWKVLNGQIPVRLLVKNGWSTETRSLYVHHSQANRLKSILTS
jgi:hypothetical protein